MPTKLVKSRWIPIRTNPFQNRRDQQLESFAITSWCQQLNNEEMLDGGIYCKSVTEAPHNRLVSTDEKWRYPTQMTQISAFQRPASAVNEEVGDNCRMLLGKCRWDCLNGEMEEDDNSI